MKKAILFFVGVLAVVCCIKALRGREQLWATTWRSSRVTAPASARLDATYGKIPLQFIPNEGQMDEKVDFYVQGRDKTIYFTSEGLTFVLNSSAGSSADRWVAKLDFQGANEGVRPVALERSGAVISYFKGKPEEWKAGIAAASKVIYRKLWPGIDLIYSGTVDRMKYEFVVHPGADPSRINLAYRGVEQVALTEKGRLAVKTPSGSFEDDIPRAYQELGADRADIPVKYVLRGDAKSPDPKAAGGLQDPPVPPTIMYGFEVGEYDPSRTLVLDPAVLVYCGYIGSSENDLGLGIAVDGQGNTYITGNSGSSDSSFPLLVGPDLTFNGDWDVFVAKLNASGTELIYCGYIGGSESDQGLGIAVDGLGNAYVTGEADSTQYDFPVITGPDLTFNGGVSDIFVAKVEADGAGLVYCGYIGGSGNEYAEGVAVDGSGNVYVTGGTSSSSDFPVVVGPDPSYNGSYNDAFVAKVNADGTGLSYCGYIGGSSTDGGEAIAVDSSGNAYVTGWTDSNAESGFPQIVGPDLSPNGYRDAFVAKVTADGAELVYCGYIGGSSSEHGYGIAVDSLGNAYITGQTNSSAATFPVTVGPDLIRGGYADAYVAKVKADGTGLVYCGYIGGSDSDFGFGIAVDGQGSAHIIGYTVSTQTSFPVVAGPDLTYNGGTYDAYVAKVKADGTGLVYCGYIGGSDNDFGKSIAIDGQGGIYVTGYTHSTEDTFPVTVGPDLTYTANADVYVAKVVMNDMRTDFNQDGQEDILWRYYGSGAYQGLNVIWLMAQSGAPSPIPPGKSQSAALGTSLLTGMTASVIYQTQAGGRQAAIPVQKSAIKTVLTGGKAPALKAKQIVRQPMDRGRALSKMDRFRGRERDVMSVPIRKDALDITMLSSGTAEIASITLGTEVVFSQVLDTAWEIAGTGDFNGDGKTDILWRYYGTGAYQGLNDIWFMDGTTFVSEAVFSQVADTNWRIDGTGDFNGDGETDILWRYYGTGAYQGLNDIWFMDGTTFVSEAVFSQVLDTDWRIVGAGDFNGDGDTDILWRYYGTGAYQGLNDIWFMDGTTFVSEAVFSQVTDIFWEIAGTGDFNGDGHTDILWRYCGASAYQGLNDIWYMNGTIFMNEEVFSQVLDTNWRIVNR